MSTEKIRWGILATGGIAAEFAADLQLLPDAELVAVASRTQAAADSFAARFGVPRAYGTWAALAEDPEVDVVYVATPHNAHYAASALLLSAGKAVLCEKPFTLNLQDAEALFDLAHKQGVFLMEAMWMRCNPVARRVAELVADGAVGQVALVQADFGVPGPFAPEHRMRNPELGGGALLDLGVYPVTFAHMMLGKPAQVTARATLTPEGVDATTGLLLGWEDGALAALSCGITAGSPVRAVVAGDLGRIEVPSPFFRADRFTWYRADGDPTAGETVELPRRGRGYVHEAEEVMRCLRAGLLESPSVSRQDTLDVMAVLDAARAQIGVRYPGE
ncbi:Gfo/Idh/MocA family protein [Streptacidiphilus monticola]|uniref:Gfo/Idh/MocA family protein n=1 Tax=Streptacidiphilus monticola TaxID=2161674 RepID=A0ABW1FWG9_9ACTN